MVNPLSPGEGTAPTFVLRQQGHDKTQQVFRSAERKIQQSVEYSRASTKQTANLQILQTLSEDRQARRQDGDRNSTYRLTV
jgi:hypothetical protein